MGADTRDPPFFFAKPADAVVPLPTTVPYPSATSDLHHEIELVAALKGGGENLTPDQAIALVFGYAVGVDLTRRDLQNAAKAKGHPWEAGKAFDASAPLSALRPMSGPPPQGAIFLSVNGVEKQRGELADMIWNVAEVIAKASQLWRLEAGDLIFTGTPEGIGPLVAGDTVTAGIYGLDTLQHRVVTGRE
jgi:fumarylpyruvate hydrolase